MAAAVPAALAAASSAAAAAAAAAGGFPVEFLSPAAEVVRASPDELPLM